MYTRDGDIESGRRWFSCVLVLGSGRSGIPGAGSGPRLMIDDTEIAWLSGVCQPRRQGEVSHDGDGMCRGGVLGRCEGLTMEEEEEEEGNGPMRRGLANNRDMGGE